MCGFRLPDASAKEGGLPVQPALLRNVGRRAEVEDVPQVQPAPFGERGQERLRHGPDFEHERSSWPQRARDGHQRLEGTAPAEVSEAIAEAEGTLEPPAPG